MGKISPVSIKYNIVAKFVAEGTVDKPDVIGAVFGQTEGLLGEDMDLRELQKNGKIGRINVELESKDGKTEGRIEIPTSLDKAETTIIAATVETIERVGPCDAKITIEKIEDVRGSKREYVLERAKKLFEELSSGVPDSREMESAITTSARVARIQEYGTERLPCGPDMDNEEIIVVEGRADVLALLRYGIKNVIAMNGTSIPKTIKDISQEKSITLFIDGDRGGILIARDVIDNCKIKFIAQAPAGKEVEELTGKEILVSLRAKQPTEEFFQSMKSAERETTRASREMRAPRGGRDGRGFGRAHSRYERTSGHEYREPRAQAEETADIGEVQELSSGQMEKLMKIASALDGTKNACVADSNMEIMRKVSSRNLNALRPSADNFALVVDGIATNSTVKIAERLHCRHLAAKNFSLNIKTKINLISI